MGTIRFTPETLARAFHADIQGKFALSELCNDDMKVEQRTSKAALFIDSKFLSRFDHTQRIYKLSEKDVACLIILFGADAVDSLLSSRFFEFKNNIQQ